MEIAPIPGIRFTPAAPRIRATDATTPVFAIDELAAIEIDPAFSREEKAYEGMGNGYEDLQEEDDEEYADPRYAPYAMRVTGRRLNCVA